MTIADPDRLEIGASPIHGNGVFARQAIRGGELIATYEGPSTAVDGPHVLWVEDEGDSWRGIDGTGLLRWLNHCRDPNVEFDGTDLYARRDIELGEELVFDYGEEWADVP